MMLHEAVMLEIYRQALSASELASPRCQSRESNASGPAPGDARCPSNESHCSANDCLTPAPTPTPTPMASSPVGLPLTATLAPAAAAALLPPQSAAMAAYLAAAQQNHLLLTNPLAAAASLVQQVSQAHNSPSPAQEPALDFSRKRTPSLDGEEQEQPSDEEEDQESGVTAAVDSPLDLSVTTRKRQSAADQEPPARKLPRGGSGAGDYKSPLPPGTWVPPLNPYLAAVAAASSMSPKSGLDWNGGSKRPPNEATKALEKMTELSRLGASEETTPASRGSSGGGNRHSAWQSHWLNKGADAAKDVFKCVWCKQSFPTLATLTTHMKETQHCGVPSSNSCSSGSQQAPTTRPANSTASSTSSSSSSSSSISVSASSCAKAELNMLIKETMPLPRKLVRGQDVWLGKGAEQTRQILKCMWCGQSFRSLAEMTSHMQETQHYTNIISQEQIISWKSGDEKTPGPASSTATPTATPTVSAVLTCKVCDQAFPTLKELSSHMAQQAHYKEAQLPTRSSPAPAPPPTAATPTTSAKRGGRGTREKRKKSLPVRKLLELERSGGGSSSLASSLDSALKPLRDFAAATKITCEKCGSKIETALFVEHIRKCLGESMPIPPRRQPPPQQSQPATQSSGSPAGGASVLNALEQLIEKSFESRARSGNSAGHGGYLESSHGTPLGSSILKRLGIDDSGDYTKPLMDHAQTMQLLRCSSAYAGRDRDRSASESSSASRLESTPTPSARRTPTPSPCQIKLEPMEQHPEQPHISVKKEFSLQERVREATRSPSLASERSITPTSISAGVAAPTNDSSSLSALNSMFDQLSSLKQQLSENNNNNNNNQVIKQRSAHPLAALQKLCETTEAPRSSSAASATSTSTSAAAANGGNDLVAFSWACNEALLSAADSSVIKCSFCDTPFSSKGAYRHHLSKVHFVKEEIEVRSPAAQSPAKSPARSPAAQSPQQQQQQQQQPTINPYEESPQSKFLKYAELAKQLSSKNA